MPMSWMSNYGTVDQAIDDSKVQCFDKTKRNYKTLVAAAKNLKFSSEVESSVT